MSVHDHHAAPQAGLLEGRPLHLRAEAGTLQLDWVALGRLLAFIVATHVLCGILLLAHGLPLPYFPDDQPSFLLMMFIGVFIVGYVAFAVQVALDMVRQVGGGSPLALGSRLGQWAGIMVLLSIFIVAFDLILLNNAGLKPALQTVNPGWHDGALEAWERFLFGGTLPSEWIAAHASASFMNLMNRIYSSFGAFMIVSLILALQRAGTAGGARLVLAFGISLTTTLLISAAMPTRGPLFEHPEWFARFSGFGAGTLADHLAQTVSDYGRPAERLRYTVAGIAAFPSYHVAAWTCGLWHWRHLPRMLVAAAVLLWAANWLSTVALGWHYVLDGAAGVGIAMVGVCAARRLIPGDRQPDAAGTGVAVAGCSRSIEHSGHGR